MPADLTAGIEYNYDNLRDEMKGYNRKTRQEVHTESAFLQNEWKRFWNRSVLLEGNWPLCTSHKHCCDTKLLKFITNI